VSAAVDTADALLLVLAAALIPIAGLVAAADAAISTVSSARVEEMHREGRRGAASLLAITQDRSRYNNLLLLVRLAAELAATVTAGAVAFSTWGFHLWVAVAVIAIMLLVSYVVIGVLPRTLGRQHPYGVGLPAAGPTRALGRVLAPVAKLLILIGNAITPVRGFPEGPFSSDVELREMVELAGDRGVVHESEREMLQSVFDLGDTIVREVMVPRTEVVWVEGSKTLRQAVHLADRSGFSRIPVIGEDVDDVLGVVYVKDLIARLLSLDGDDRGPQVTELMRPAVFVPESKNVDQLLREMQRDRTHVAIVGDEYGGTAGVVTMEDIVEEIVGEITDEYDPDTPAPIEHLDDGSVRVSARLPVEDLGEVFDVELPAEDVETVGGLLAQLLGRVALPGSQADINGLHLVAEGGTDRRGRQRVMSLVARRIDDSGGPQDTTARGSAAGAGGGAEARDAAGRPIGDGAGGADGSAADGRTASDRHGPADTHSGNGTGGGTSPDARPGGRAWTPRAGASDRQRTA
jgi:CBS domain containing-hemolysin-like protein